MQSALEWFSLAVLPAFLVLDLIWRGYRNERARHWKLRALVISGFNFWLSLAIGTFWGSVFGDASLLNGAALGTFGGAIVGVVAYEFVHYWYHRAAHRFDGVWRFVGHQMHHSAESIDAFGAYYLHPIDALLFTSWAVLVFFPVLGLSPEAGALAAAFLGFNAVFQHANIETPRWLGYFIQRPESHRVHHARGVHAFNYADLPLWDLVFGTFRNPASVEGMKAGFYRGASARIPEMLLGVDVSTPRG